jgi:2-phosphosulfolactate phosphatase
MTRTLELALLPAEAEHMEADCFIVIDLLRATTTIATLFGRGLLDLVVVDRIEEARARARREERLLFGEVGGLRPEGFDYGNSPIEAGEAAVAGRGAVLFTTNGTRAICAVAGKGVVFTGALANLSAVVGRASVFERVVLVCAGTEAGQRFALEDFAAAGRMAHALAEAVPGLVVDDECAAAMETAGSGAEAGKLIVRSRHGQALASLGLTEDITFAARVDTARVVPVVVEQGAGWARLEAAD